MRWVIAVVVVIVWALAAPPAEAQTASEGWSPKEVEPVESAGEVVLTFTAVEAGRIVYYTYDGDCNRQPVAAYPYMPPIDEDCGRPQARAGEDYAAVRGEWIFTEPGSRTIRVPILDDDIDEPEEPFGVHASTYDDGAEQLSVYVAVVRIVDDDPKVETDAGRATSTTVTTAEDGPAGDRTVAAADPPAPVRVPSAQIPAGPASSLGSTTTTSGRRIDIEADVEEPGDLQPGPGFELMAGRLPERGAERVDRGGPASLAGFGLSSVAVASVVAWARRRWRWSTRS